MLDPSNLQQQEALGIVGVNLIYGAFFLTKIRRLSWALWLMISGPAALKST